MHFKSSWICHNLFSVAHVHYYVTVELLLILVIRTVLFVWFYPSDKRYVEVPEKGPVSTSAWRKIKLTAYAWIVYFVIILMIGLPTSSYYAEISIRSETFFFADLLGSVAAITSTLQFLPQIRTTMKRKVSFLV